MIVFYSNTGHAHLTGFAYAEVTLMSTAKKLSTPFSGPLPPSITGMLGLACRRDADLEDSQVLRAFWNWPSLRCPEHIDLRITTSGDDFASQGVGGSLHNIIL